MTKRIEELDRNFKTAVASKKDGLLWLDASDRRLTTRGLWWRAENKGVFNRLPLRAQSVVREAVWTLAKAPSSARVCFKSDTTRLSARAANEALAPMAHMPGTGHSGLALYVGAPFRMRPWRMAVPSLDKPSYEAVFFENLPRAMREYTLYLPLYNNLVKLELGFSRGARIEAPSAPALRKPVVFYGTSITQGGCASTAGSDYVSTVGRLLNLDVINLGFSGNGCGEPEVARLVGEIDAGLFVLDYAGNVQTPGLKKTLPEFYRILRRRHPRTPILLLSMICFSHVSYSIQHREGHEAKRDVMIHFYSRMRRAGDHNLHFVDGSALIPFGMDAAYVDGVHPSDHGFRIMAERLAPFIEMILETEAR
ncbi:MAG: SGNH/GDSL hydrolase family protein [Verrucomicrobia bacterium]|nr:SGNH/GDSL hydrolase family protein [Verrucomicrobiota bacterium]